jgi:predicted acyltransferase (DUF342 family)
MSIAIANVNVTTDTFSNLIGRVNQAFDIISNHVITVDNSSSGNSSSGNGYITGIFGATTLFAGSALRGGSVASPSTLVISSNVTMQANLLVVGTISHINSVSLANTLVVTGNTILANTLTVTGNTTLANTLTVTGNTTLSNTLTVTGNTRLSNTLTVTGNTTLSNTLAVTGNTTLANTLTVIGNTILSNTLVVTGSSTLANTLSVTGATTLSNTVTIIGASSVANTLSVTGASTLANTLAVTGAVTLSNTLSVTGNTTLGYTSVSGDTIHINLYGTDDRDAFIDFHSSGNTSVPVYGASVGKYSGSNGNFQIIDMGSGNFILRSQEGNIKFLTGSTTRMSVVSNGNIGISTESPIYKLDVNGTLRSIGDVTFSSQLNVTGNTTINGNTNLNSTLIVTGNTTVSRLNVTGNTDITGNTTLANTLTVTGNTRLSNTLIVTGNTTLANTLTVTGNTTLSNTLAVTGNTTLANTLTVTGNTTLSNTLVVIGNTTLSNTLTVTGNTTLSLLNVSGLTTMQVSDSNPALKITQAGAGHALFIEDSTSPDATPTVITAAGSLVLGGNSTINLGAAGAGQITSIVTSGPGLMSINTGNVSNQGARITLYKTRSDNVLTYSAISSSDEVGRIHFYADDGGQAIEAARITISTLGGGTIGPNSMPTTMNFYTTGDGSNSSLTGGPKLTLSPSGNVGIGVTTSIPNAKLQVVGTANVSGNVAIGGQLSVSGGQLSVSGGISSGGNNIFGGQLSKILSEVLLNSANIASATYSNKSFLTANSSPTGIVIRPDGRKMYISDNGVAADKVMEYDIIVPWDISTSTFSNNFISVAAQDLNVYDLQISPDGRKMIIAGGTNLSVYQYTLSTPWSVNTATYDSKTFSISSYANSIIGLFVKHSGDKFYITDNVLDNIIEYNMSTPWDVTTATYSGNVSTSAYETAVNALTFTRDGQKMFTTGTSGDTIDMHLLSTPWCVNTATYVSEISISTQELTASGLAMSPDGSNFYVVGNTTDTVYQYMANSLFEVVANTVFHGRVSVDDQVGIGTSNPNTSLTVDGPIALRPPLTITSNSYVVDYLDSSLIFSGAANCNIIMPQANTYPGRILYVKNITAISVNSTSSNIKPLGSNTAANNILTNTAGKFAMLQSDANNWIVMMGN